MKCNKCGFENNDNSRFCFKCGDRLINNNEVNLNENVINQNLNSKKVDKSKNKMLYIAIGGGVLGIILISIVGFLIIKNLFFSKDNLSNIFDPNQPILIEKDGKYGYINSNGKKIIEPKYTYASNFYGNHAIVDGTTTIDGEEVKAYHVIDKKGKIKATALSSSAIKYIQEQNIWIVAGKLYNENLKQLSKDNVEVSYAKNGILSWIDKKNKKAGIMKKNGKITYTYKFKDGEDYFSISMADKDSSLKEDYCQINVQNKKYAIANCNSGKIIYDFTENYITAKENNIFSITTFKPYSKIAELYIFKDNIEYQTKDNNVSISYSPGYLKIYDVSKDYSKRYTYFNLNTKETSTKEPTEAVDLNNYIETYKDYSKFNCDKGVGLKNKNKTIVNCEWTSIDFLDELLFKYLKSKGKSYIFATKDNKVSLIDINKNKVVKEFNSNYITNYNLSTFISYTDKDSDKKVVYNLLTGKEIKTDKTNEITINSNYIKIKDTDSIKYYNTKLKLIYTVEK